MEPELEKAAISGDIEVLKNKVESKEGDNYLLSKSYLWGGGSNILHLALWNDKIEFLKECMKILKPDILQKLISQQDDDGFNPLHVAVESVEVVRLMLDIYRTKPPLQLLVPGDLNHPRNRPWLATTSLSYENGTPLHRALGHTFQESALEILSMDMDLLCDMVDGKGNSPLFLAVKNQCTRVAETILKSSTTHKLCGEYGSTAFHFAPKSSDTVLRLLLEKHSKIIDKVEDNGFNVLHRWVELGEKWPFNIISEENFRTAKATMFRKLVYMPAQKSSGDSPLHTAINNASSKIDIVQALVEGYQQEITVKDDTTSFLSNDPPWKTTNNKGLTPLHLALDLQEEKVALYLLSIDSTLCKINDAQNNSPLFLAVKKGANQVAEKILTSFKEYNTTGRGGSTALHFIPASNSSGNIMRLLLEKHPELIKKEDENGWNVLHQWANMGEDWPLQFLIDGNFYEAKLKTFRELIFKGNKEANDNPLHIGVQSKNIKFVHTLVRGYRLVRGNDEHMGKGDDEELPWNMKNKKQETPFAIALTSQLDVALRFLSMELEFPKTDVHDKLQQVVHRFSQTLQFQWLESCPENILRLLLEKHVTFLDVSCEKNFNVVHEWASRGAVWPLRLLLQGNKFPDARAKVFKELIYKRDTIEGNNPLHLAAKSGYYEVVKELVIGYDRENENRQQEIPPWMIKNTRDGDTPLHLAIKLDHINIVMFLLSKLNLPTWNMQNNKGESVLFLAITKQTKMFEHCVLHIIKTQEVGLSDKESNNEHVAVVNWLRSCSETILREVLKNCPDFLKAIDIEESNVLHKWAEDGKELPLTIISNSEDFTSARTKIYDDLIKKKDKKYGNTPLHTATKYKKGNFVEALLKHYKDEDIVLPWKITNNNGDTPLHLAISSVDELISSKLLLRDPSTCQIRNKIGESPLFLAVASKLHTVVELILTQQQHITFSMLRNNEDQTILHLLSRVPESTAMMLLEKFWWVINLRDKQGRTALDIYQKENLSSDVKYFLENPSMIKKETFDCFTLCEKDELSTVLSYNDFDFLHNIKLKTYQDYLSLLKNPSVGELKNYLLELDWTTPLHKAIERKDIYFARALLVDDKVERNIKNKKGDTAMQLLSNICNQDPQWDQMCKLININPHLRTRYIQSATELDQMRSTLSVVAGLLATITFAAGFTLPGGLHGDSGYAILATKISFLVFMLADAFAMCTSMLVLFCLMWSMVSERDMSYLLVDRSVTILMFSLFSTMVAFTTGIYVTISHSSFWAAILILVMCNFFGIFAVNSVLYFVFSMLYSKELKGNKLSTLREESASTSANTDSGNASERSNNRDENCSALFMKVKRLMSRGNQDKKDSTCSLNEVHLEPLKENKSILPSDDSKKSSERWNKLVQTFFGILKGKKLNSMGNQDTKDSTQSLEEGKPSTSKNDTPGTELN